MAEDDRKAAGAGIGHNGGPPLEAGRGWRTHAWRRAKADLAPRAGLEVVRRHVARAKALGMPYSLYASIRLGTGRDVRALMLTGAALGWRREGRHPAPAVVARLAAVEEAERLLLSRAVPGPAGAPARMAGVAFAAAGPAPAPEASWSDRRRAVLAVTAARRLPADTVVMIGGRAQERGWAEAAWLARYVEAETFFAAGE